MRLSRALSTAALLGLLAAPAAAGEGTAPIGVPGRAQGRAGAGLVAGDDAFAVARNPAALARLQRDRLALGLQAAGWRFDLEDRPGLRGGADNRAIGGLAFAWSHALGRRGIRGWADPFEVPIRAVFGPVIQQAREGRGEIRIDLTDAPKSVEVRAKGSKVAVRDLLLRLLPAKGGTPADSSSATGAPLTEADWMRLAAWNAPKWSAEAATLVVSYRYAFAAGAGDADFAVVRVDVDGKERTRRDHAPPAAKAGNDGNDGNGGPAGGTPEVRPTPMADLLDAPDPDAVARLERGHWRLGIAATPAAYFSTAVDAPGAPSGYRLQYAVESLTIGLANELFEGFAVGVSGRLYASTILDLQMPATVGNNAGGVQTDALNLDPAVTVGFGFSAGATWVPCPRKCLTVGLHYTSRSFMGPHEGDAEMTGLSIPLVSVNNVTGRWDASVRGLNLPQHAGLGLAWRPGAEEGNDGWLLVAADLTWWDWGEEANDIKIVLESGDANAANATGSTTSTVRVPLNWKDRWSAAVGVTVRPLDPWLLHAGYAYGRNPSPNHSTHPLLPAVMRHHLAAGTTLKVGDFELSLSAVAGLPEEVTLAGNGGELTVYELGGTFSVQYDF